MKSLQTYNNPTLQMQSTNTINQESRGTVSFDEFPRESDLLHLQKPAQYLGGEFNSVIKSDSNIDIHFALAFPDTYEVGMSHLGIQILYEIINADSQSWAERVFMPLPEMERLLKDRNKPLTSLESKRPIGDFDILGFSLQYELCATNILAMLDLSGIPFNASDRNAKHPLIIGGGPYAYHPEAIAPFFDAFLIGDAEDAIKEIIDVIRDFKLDTSQSTTSIETKNARLNRLALIEGVYIPAHFEPSSSANSPVLDSLAVKSSIKKTVKRRVLPSLEGAPSVSKPIIPNIKTIHNRLNIEVMRGCVRGCRFCQAGYLYRPQRERNPKEILDIIETTLPESGFEELSLLSLSTADYCSVVPLVTEVMDCYSEQDRLSISFPSTRVDALTPELLEQVQRVRRTGFTIAPEAGTQRLRDVINKGVSDEQILETCGNVFRMGWTGIKLYFMIGLPTETEEDILGIVDIAQRIKELPSARGKKITVSVSTHVPKPHTPFQWARQPTTAEVKQTHSLLAHELKRRGINFRYSDSFSSFLEGVMCRADRKVSKVIQRAYELGCRLDAWSEHIDEAKWMQAFEQLQIDPHIYLEERNVEDILPWDHLSCEISKDYFAREYKRALLTRVTPDCLTKSCSVCGICDYDAIRNVLHSPQTTREELVKKPVPLSNSQPQIQALCRIRIKYAKLNSMRFLGHLDLQSLIQRAIRRASIPIAYSQGFHPLARLVCGPPLQLGVASSAEYADLYLTESLEPELVKDYLNSATPPDFVVLDAFSIDIRAGSIQSEIVSQTFRATLLKSFAPEDSALRYFMNSLGHSTKDDFSAVVAKLKVSRPGLPKPKSRKFKKPQSFALREFITECRVDSPTDSGNQTHSTQSDKAADTIYFEFSLRHDPTRASPRPFEVIQAISGINSGDCLLEKTRTDFRNTC